MFIRTPKDKLAREIGLVALIFMGIGATIGGGIFVLISAGAQVAGPYLPFSFLLGAVLSLVVALMYAEITSSMPVSGSDLEYVFNVYDSSLVPFLVSWLILVGDLAYVAINVLGFSGYVGNYSSIPGVWISVVVLVGVYILNIMGIQMAAKFEGIVALILILILTTFIIVVGSSLPVEPVVSYGSGGNFSPFGILTGAALVFTAFLGYQNIAAVSGEVKNPQRNLPIALVATVLITAAIYISISYIVTRVLPLDVLMEVETPLLVAASLKGRALEGAILLAAVLATLNTVVATVLVTSRELYRMAEQGFFKSVLTRLNTRKIPHYTVLASVLLAFLLVATDSVVFVAYIGNTSFLIALIMVAISYIRLRYRRPFLARPFRLPLFPLVPFFVIGFASLFLIGAGIMSVLTTILGLLFGFVFYLLSWVDFEKIPWVVVGVVSFVLLEAGLFWYFWFIY